MEEELFRKLNSMDEKLDAIHVQSIENKHKIKELHSFRNYLLGVTTAIAGGITFIFNFIFSGFHHH